MRKLRLHTMIPAVFMAMLLASAALACNATMPSAPQPLLPNFTPSANGASNFENAFQQAVNQAAQSGQFSVTINQQDFSSWLSLRAGDYAKQEGYDWPLKNVQAGLNNNKITLYGVVTQPNVPDTPSQIVFTPSIDANG